MIVNGVDHAQTPDMSVDALLDHLGLARRGIAVALNGEVVRRSQWTQTLVRAEDVVEVVTAVAGG